MGKFKIGDRVKGVHNGILYTRNTGEEGVVFQVDRSGITHVRLDCGGSDYGYESDFELLPPAVNTETLKESLQSLHDQFRTAGNTVPALALEEVILEHFGVTWQAPQEGRWVEKESTV